MKSIRANQQRIGCLSAWLAAAVLAAGGCNLNLSHGPALYKVEKTLVVPYVAGSALSVQGRNGSIEVAKADRQDVQIIARIAAQTPERAEAVEISAQRLDDGLLRVEAIWPDGKPLNNEGCAFVIELPDADGLDLNTSNGRLAISNLAGHAKLVTSNGAIHIEGHAGSAEVSTSNGSIDAHQITGPVTARTSNGRITLEPAADNPGPFDVNTSNGSIRAQQIAGPLQAHTSNGSINMALSDANAGPIDISTSNGSIDLTLGADFAGQLRLQTSNGRINSADLHGAARLDEGKQHLLAAFGDSEQISTVRTSNSSITVRRP